VLIATGAFATHSISSQPAISAYREYRTTKRGREQHHTTTQRSWLYLSSTTLWKKSGTSVRPSKIPFMEYFSVFLTHVNFVITTALQGRYM
jgi:hypothetical protein